MQVQKGIVSENDRTPGLTYDASAMRKLLHLLKSPENAVLTAFIAFVLGWQLWFRESLARLGWGAWLYQSTVTPLIAFIFFGVNIFLVGFLVWMVVRGVISRRK